MSFSLIDNPPADPSINMTALLKAKAMTERTGQTYVVLNVDQQQHRITVHTLWENHVAWSNSYLLLGGMHLFIRYIGYLQGL